MNNIKKTACALACVFVASSFAAAQKAPGMIYISPNNDGVQDTLVVPLRISDKRYISEWSFIITDEAGNVVRTIGNKEIRPETPSEILKNLFSGKTFAEFTENLKKVFEPKKGVPVPESVTWNGVTDTGAAAPDGLYNYYFTAVDDNGNRSKTKLFPVTVDNTPPSIELKQPSEAFKIFGSLVRPSVKIEQKGSVEDLWEAKITDAKGETVRSFSWKEASPVTIEWDGKTEIGSPAAEGVYTYKIAAQDRAGNKSTQAQINNIIYDAVPRSVNMIVKDSPFSPDGNGVRDTLLVQPSMPNAAGLVSWDISIISRNEKILRSFEGTTPPKDIVFDGKTSDGSVLEDSDYQIRFRARFNNGQEASIARNFTVDSTPPQAAVILDTSIFSPDGDGRIDTIKITQEASREKQWKGSILDESGKAVKTWTFADIPSSSVVWDGLSDSGSLASDGFYTYVLISTDTAGNTGSAQSESFELNTGTTEIILTAQPRAFSPNGDRINDTVTLAPVVKTKSPVKSYKLTVLDASGTAVRTFSEKRALPKSFSWNGLADDGIRSADGSYSAVLETESVNGSIASTATQPFILDTLIPSVSVSVPYTLFSPNNDGRRDSVEFTFSDATEETQWQAQITDSAGKTVSDFVWQGKPAPFAWKGTDEAGNVVADGVYTFKIRAEDESGNSTSASVTGLTVDTRPVKTYVTAELESFSPNGDGYLDSQKFTIMTTLTEGISAWSFGIYREGTDAGSSSGSSNSSLSGTDGSDGAGSGENTAGLQLVRRWSNEDSPDLPQTIIWDGRDTDGLPAEGRLTARLDVSYEKGDVSAASVSAFLSSVTPPALTARTAPAYFSPDNDGVDDDLFISLKGSGTTPLTAWSFEINDPQNGKAFWRTGGTSSITERIIWDGRGNNGELVQAATDYPYVFTASDSLGMTTVVKGVISIDVLVIRIGDVLKIQVPSILFRSDNADFAGKDVDPIKGLEQPVIDNNMRVLRRIADILNKFREYKVTIEGHANNISGTEDEETSTAKGNIPLVPLSEARSAAVKEMLVKFGVESSRLSTVGRGGRQPVVPQTDRENWWKNRRVEFILNK